MPRRNRPRLSKVKRRRLAIAHSRDAAARQAKQATTARLSGRHARERISDPERFR